MLYTILAHRLVLPQEIRQISLHQVTLEVQPQDYRPRTTKYAKMYLSPVSLFGSSIALFRKSFRSRESALSIARHDFSIKSGSADCTATQRSIYCTRKNIGYTGFIDNLKGWEMLLTMPELRVQSLFEDSNRFASCMKFERLGQLLD